MSERSATRSSNGEDLRWVQAVGDVTIPLFAGFSVTSVIVVSDDASNFRWPGPTILVLAIASVSLVAAVQCAYHARMYLRDPAQSEVSSADRGRRWAIGTRIFYHCGIVMLLAGLGLALAPLSGKGIDNSLRWVATFIASLAALGQVAFIFEFWRSRSRRNNAVGRT
jgi:hypothetical protein